MWTSASPNDQRFSFFTLSARSGTTVPNFFVFFAELCVHATLLIIVRSFSNRCWIVHHLSFLEKKTELIYLHYRLFYNCLCILIHFLARNLQKDARTVKKPKLIFNLFPERKMIWKKFKRIQIQRKDSLSCTKKHKLNIICLCTVKKSKN